MLCGGIRLNGGGLDGSGFPMPYEDIRGFRFGIAARRILPSLPHATLPPLHWQEYDNWHRIPRPVPNPVGKMLRRLEDAGLIWSVCRYAKRSDTEWERCVALTDLGQKVVEVFGDDMQRGQRVRWDKWQEPSVAGSAERWQELRERWISEGLMQHAPHDDDDISQIQKSIDNPSRSPQLQYGNSRKYLLARIKHFDGLWGDVLMHPVLYAPDCKALAG